MRCYVPQAALSLCSPPSIPRHLGTMSRREKGASKQSSSSRAKTQTTVEIALEVITVIKNAIPMEPAKGALSGICSLLVLLQVRSWEYFLILFKVSNNAT